MQESSTLFWYISNDLECYVRWWLLWHARELVLGLMSKLWCFIVACLLKAVRRARRFQAVRALLRCGRLRPAGELLVARDTALGHRAIIDEGSGNFWSTRELGCAPQKHTFEPIDLNELDWQSPIRIHWFHEPQEEHADWHQPYLLWQNWASGPFTDRRVRWTPPDESLQESQSDDILTPLLCNSPCGAEIEAC